MLDLIKKYWPEIVAAVTALWGTFGTQIQTAIAHHGTLTLWLSAIGVIITHLIQSPVPPSPAQLAKLNKEAAARKRS